MSRSSHLKTPHPLELFSAAKPSSSSTISSVKLKSLIHTLIVSHMCRIIRALSKAKAAIVQTLKGNQSSTHFPCHRNRNMTKNIVFGSFRLHYNWCSSKSSHVIPVPLPKASHTDQELYEYECQDDSRLAGYLQWLEEKVHGDDGSGVNEIDMMAEMFIAQCHEKFKLEKQDSDRRFHDMLLRGM